MTVAIIYSKKVSRQLFKKDEANLKTNGTLYTQFLVFFEQVSGN